MNLRTVTDRGVTRKDNQDNFWASISEVDDSKCGFVCVCDGMGGLNDGGLASKMVIEAVRDGFKSGVPFRELEGIVQRVNIQILNLSQSQEKGKMGTTCTILECIEGKYKILHIGDSRCYKLSKSGKFIQLTEDHSAIKQLQLSPEKDYDMWKKYKNSLTRCVGVKPRITMDYYKGSYSKGDAFVLCSDGMWHLFEKSCFGLSDFKDINALVQKAIRNGETDNITCCMMEV